MKKWNFKNINTTNTISLGIVLIITASQCVHANGIEKLKHQCKSLKPGTEYVVKVPQVHLDAHFKKAIKWAGCDVKISTKNGKSIVKIIKKEESDDDLLAGLGDLWTWPVKDPEWMKQKEKQVAQKEKQVAQKEKQLKQKEKRLWRMERVMLMNPS